MKNNDACFNHFEASVEHIPLPDKFTFPFYYQAHPLCQLAAQQLQATLEQNPWQHNFGLHNTDIQADAIGKMFGVLVVKDNQQKLGFLAAFSGKLADANHQAPFVPPVFDMLHQDSFFTQESAEINQINQQITLLEQDEHQRFLQRTLIENTQQSQQQIQAMQRSMVTQRKQRKQQRQQAQQQLSQAHITQSEFDQLSIELSRQSVQQKHQLSQLKAHWQREISTISAKVAEHDAQLVKLKQTRKHLSHQLQQQLFAQYRFLNANGEIQDLSAIFAQSPNQQPPAGAGECAAPKLLNYAYQHDYQPIAMAEFWWGKPPKSEVKQHRNFYPACHSKCRPILGHMLQGLDVDPDPLLINTAADKDIEIVYQDDHIVVINKPADMLSVPGKQIADSVQLRMKQRFPEATGPLIVHRLDMATSGLMVIALSSAANKALVQQFIERTIEKHYVALIDGVPLQSAGDIDLPLRVDLDDRPKQLVCYEHGKTAQTHWQLVKVIANQALLNLYPKTGRTHQLRMHCAHHLGLGMPIVGDDLYGKQADRLHLHAKSLRFLHPHSKQQMHFEVPAAFE
ncbi:RluA family pseudouridine synthase [Shewanella maritima]|uniref:RluA family pseudouridine synthase n=1 Tax=Shewanella maritima TaxID=2520507 RepID=UPI003735AD98